LNYSALSYCAPFTSITTKFLTPLAGLLSSVTTNLNGPDRASNARLPKVILPIWLAL